MVENLIRMNYFNNTRDMRLKTNNSLFFSNNDKYWNTNERGLSRVLEKMAIELKIINVKYLQLQNSNNKFNRRDLVNKERNKLKILLQAKKLGNILLEENKDIFIISSQPVLGDLLKNKFYILKSKTDKFIKLILVPLLTIIKNGILYDWKPIKNKPGLWRELKDTETMPVGSEVSMNFETGINMIRL